MGRTAAGEVGWWRGAREIAGGSVEIGNSGREGNAWGVVRGRARWGVSVARRSGGARCE